jgi:hypothetical protein
LDCVRVQLKRVCSARGGGVWARYLEEVVSTYNRTFHRTIKMTPAEALKAAHPLPGSPPAAYIAAATLRHQIMDNTAKAGRYNLEVVARERAKVLEPLRIGEAVLVGVPRERKKHSVVTGKCVDRCSQPRTRACD